MAEIRNTKEPIEGSEVGLRKASTSELILELTTRRLTPADVNALQSLHTEEPSEKLQVEKPVIGSEDKETGETTSETPSLVEEIAKAVVRKSVNAKLRAGTKVGDLVIVKDNALGEGFGNKGPDNMRTPSSACGFQSLCDMINSSPRMHISEFIKSQLVSIAPSDIDQKNMVLTMHFFQDQVVSGRMGRGGDSNPAYIQVELPKATMEKFVLLIKTSPDLLEDFYQKVFPGLDCEDAENVYATGMRRIKTDTFYLVDDPIKLQEANNIAARRYQDSTTIRLARTFIESLNKYSYRNGPYGTGKEFKNMYNSD